MMLFETKNQRQCEIYLLFVPRFSVFLCTGHIEPCVHDDVAEVQEALTNDFETNTMCMLKFLNFMKLYPVTFKQILTTSVENFDPYL